MKPSMFWVSIPNCPAASAIPANSAADCGISFDILIIDSRNLSITSFGASTVFLTPAKADSKSMPVFIAAPPATVIAVATVPMAAVATLAPIPAAFPMPEKDFAVTLAAFVPFEFTCLMSLLRSFSAPALSIEVSIVILPSAIYCATCLYVI